MLHSNGSRVTSMKRSEIEVGVGTDVRWKRI